MSIEIIKNISLVVSAILNVIALLTFLVKPIREKFVGFIKKSTNDKEQDNKIQQQEKDLKEIKAMLKEHIEQDKVKQEHIALLMNGEMATLRNDILAICKKCNKRGSITTLERMNLIDMYGAYHDLGGDTYCTSQYEVCMELSEINE